jgi:hypothetical protein
MGTRDSDGNHGGGQLVESGEAGKEEDSSAALRLLIVQNEREFGPAPRAPSR